MSLTLRSRPIAVDIARQMVARDIGAAVEPEAITAAVEGLYKRLSANLRRSFGMDGYNALITRALVRAQTRHPVLKDMRGAADTGIQLDRIVASADAHGVHVVVAAIESLLAALIDILSGLIGADMVMNLLDPDGVQ